MRYLKYISFAIAALLIGLLVTLYARYGGGKPYADVSTTPLIDKSLLEKVLEYPENIGNLAVAADGRVFFTVHPESRPTGHKLLAFKNGKFEPFPSASAQTDYFDAVMGLKIDTKGRLWTLDHGQHGTGKTRLMAFDTNNGQLLFDHVFPKDVAPMGSFLQDLNVDAAGEYIYIADVSFWRKQPGLVVVNTATRQS
ncbi:MAG: L-dopachrome tautomerase-related protein, partial [Rhodoferax sp.]